MNIIAVIPARGGSKRVPRKNIKLIAGKPLIAWSIDEARKSKYINEVIVSTEDGEIAKVAEQYGAKVIIRPQELAVDTAKTPPVLLHVVEELEKNSYKPDIVVLLQPTTPSRTVDTIDAGIEKLINSHNDSVFSAFYKMRTMPLWKKHHDSSVSSLYDYHLRPRSQEPQLNEKIFSEDGAFYAIKIDALKQYRDFIGENPALLEVKRHIDIDTEDDFNQVEKQLLERDSQDSPTLI